MVDLESDLITAAEIQPADASDTETMVDSVVQAQLNQNEAGCEQEIEEVVADKGYPSAANLELATSLGVRTYVPEPKRQYQSRWTDKPEENKRAVYGNHRRLRTKKSKQLQRRRSECCERTFAHVCDSGGMRRSWLRGKLDVAKRYLIAVAAHNLGRIMRMLFGIGKPKALQGQGDLAALAQLISAWLFALVARLDAALRPSRPTPVRCGAPPSHIPKHLTSTGC